jgi:hypothetical protein
VKFVLLVIAVFFAACNDPMVESNSSSVARKCEYQGSEIDCEAFDRIMDGRAGGAVRKTLAVNVVAAIDIVENNLSILENTRDVKNENFEGQVVSCEVSTSTDQIFHLELNNQTLKMTNKKENVVLNLKRVGAITSSYFGDWTYDELDENGRLGGRIMISLSPSKIKVSAQCFYY